MGSGYWQQKAFAGTSSASATTCLHLKRLLAHPAQHWENTLEKRNHQTSVPGNAPSIGPPPLPYQVLIQALSRACQQLGVAAGCQSPMCSLSAAQGRHWDVQLPSCPTQVRCSHRSTKRYTRGLQKERPLWHQLEPVLSLTRGESTTRAKGRA